MRAYGCGKAYEARVDDTYSYTHKRTGELKLAKARKHPTDRRWKKKARRLGKLEEQGVIEGVEF